MTIASTESSDATQSSVSQAYRNLPSVSAVLAELEDIDVTTDILVDIVRTQLELAREAIRAGETIDQRAAIERCRSALSAIESTRFDEVINGTGILLHTNLGRSPVSQATAAAMAAAASSYLALEIDPETNTRGGRMDEASRLMQLLTGAEATLVVNNNAAAVLLTLSALAGGREVIVSRGEAVEIGGGFRIPEVIAQSGCRLVEVGTTNRTYAVDYLRGCGPNTAALLKVHASNFRIEGFTAGVTTAELSVVAQEKEIPLVEDLGSGAFLHTEPYGLRHEPTVREAIQAGASLVTLSGDKLLGGPQAGIIAGRRDLVQIIERHPLARALRVDKSTLAGVLATLRHYIKGAAETEIPIWRMIGTSTEALSARASDIGDPLGLRVIESSASIGGGSLPGETMPSIAIGIESTQPDEIARRLRLGKPSVFPYIRDGVVLIDLRTVRPEQDDALVEALRKVLP